MTQSQCVRWLAKHLDLLGAKKRKPVALCPHFFKDVISVKEDTQAIEAFETMVDQNIQVRYCIAHRRTVAHNGCQLANRDAHTRTHDRLCLLSAMFQGVAVVDADGKLVGNLSIRDLKLIGHDAAMFWRLQQTVKNFLEKVRCTAHSRTHSHSLTSEQSGRVALRAHSLGCYAYLCARRFVTSMQPVMCVVTGMPSTCCQRRRCVTSSQC